jgi:hypothetical protein
MAIRAADKARDRLSVGYALDRLWSETMGLPVGDSKEGPLRLLAKLLHREGVPYALIGGLAVQVHTADPRTTLDIDVAVPTYRDIPDRALREAGFEHTGRHDHSDNWRAPGPGAVRFRVAVQFSAEDQGLAAAVEHASVLDLGDGLALRVVTVDDLIELKLLAAEEPTRRRSKRERDLADISALLEEHPEVQSSDLLARVERVRTVVLTARLDVHVGGDEK